MSTYRTLSATFHLTHDCNLRCDYCYTGQKVGKAMSDEILENSLAFVLEQAKKNQAERLDITFFGGEPLLAKEKIYRIVDELDQRAPQLTRSYKLSTNGTLLTEEVMHQLLHRRVFLSLSLDGSPEINDRYRKRAGGQGTAKRIEQAARLLLQHNPCTSVTCVVTPDTAGQIASSVDYLFELGFRYITTTLDYSADWSTSHFKILKKSYQQLAKWYEAKMLAEERFYLSFFDERIQTRTHKPLVAHERCHVAGKHFSIAPDGALYPCIQFVTTEGRPEFIIGHVNEGFDEACKQHIHKASEKEKPECAGCALEARCSKWCSCINFASTGTIDQASPIACYNERILMEIVDRTADRLWKKRSNMFVHKHYNPDYPIIAHLEANL